MIGIQNDTSRKKKEQVVKQCEIVRECLSHTPAHACVYMCCVCVFAGECEKERAQNRTERVRKKRTVICTDCTRQEQCSIVQ